MGDTAKTSASLWNELVKTALLGTERVGLPELRVNDGTGGLLSQLSLSHRERTLLTASAILSVHRKCGLLPRSTESPGFASSDPDTAPRCSPNATTYLKRMLEGQFPALLPEFLSVLQESGQRLPEEMLPDALDAARKDSHLRSLMAGVLGKRGEWLASLNPEWSYVGVKVDAAEWETASRPSRISVLRELRRNEPAAAIDLLNSTWKKDGAEDRMAFIGELQTGLHASDEEFLEPALDDRRKEVRKKAAELLVQLPESQFVQRMISRVRPLIAAHSSSGSKLMRALTRQSKLEITLPDSCDEGMVRDGIEPLPPQGTGEKAWWLSQLLASVPIAFWNEHLKFTAEQCVEEAKKSEYGEVLIPAWAKATRRENHLQWAEAILSFALTEKRNFQLLSVVEVLPDSQRDPVVIKLLCADRNLIGYAHPGFNLLQCFPGPWSERLGRALLDFLHYQVKQSKEGKLALTYTWFPNPERFAMMMPISLATEAQDSLTEHLGDQSFFKAVQTFLEILQFRYRMQREIRK